MYLTLLGRPKGTLELLCESPILLLLRPARKLQIYGGTTNAVVMLFAYRTLEALYVLLRDLGLVLEVRLPVSFHRVYPEEATGR